MTEARDADTMQDDDDLLPLRPYGETLWQGRRVIRLAVLAVSVLFAVVVLMMAILFPRERISSIHFRLLFEGASEGEYPNKMPFSTAEIVSPAVITEVFKANNLQQYGTYESVKNAIFVQRSSPQLDLLNFEYQSRLADTRLTPVDRARIEAEFSQKREALTDPSFSISLRRTDWLKTLPAALAEKILNDALATWAVQAERMGAMKYQLPVLSSTVLSKESLETEDYLVAADLLRAKAIRIIKTLAELEKVPGALTIRTSKSGVSLPEIRANIEDALRFDLEPLLGIIRSEGITKNARLLSLYATTQVFQIRLDKVAAEGRARAMQQSLADYMTQRGSRAASMDSKPGSTGSARPQPFEGGTLIPQLGDAFLNRLIEMSSTTQESEVEYRQKLTDDIIKENIDVTALDKELAYYEDVVRGVQGIGNRPAGSAEMVKLVTDRTQKAFGAVAKAADQLVELYGELSAQNLNPAARLYTVTTPYSQRTQVSLSYRTLLYAYLLLVVLTVIASSAWILIHSVTARRAAA